METILSDFKKPVSKLKSGITLIFLVDDHPVFLEILKGDLLSLPNTEIMTFNSGEDCLKHMYLNPSLVVLDYDLSGVDETPNLMNGVQVLKKIKKTHPKTEVVMLSGWDNVAVATTSIKLGAFDYVVKNEHALLNVRNKIKNIFRKFRIMKQLREERIAKWVISGIFGICLIFSFFADKIIN
jgi:DNA-binding NarL/FixJ family response regulator